MDVSLLCDVENAKLAIIPTIVVPFAFLGFLLNALAAVIAGFFGIKLSTEGPKRLLEVLLHKKVLVSALIMNAVIWGGYKGYQYWKDLPSPLLWVEWKNSDNISSQKKYEDVISRDSGEWPLKVSEIEQDWRVKLPSGVFNSPIISGGSVFAGTKNGYVYELNKDNGQTIRRFFVGTHVTPQPLIFGGKLYVGEGIHPTHHARIYQFDLASGQLTKTFSTQGHTEGTPLIVKNGGGNILLVAAGSDGVYGLNADTMEEIWHQQLPHADSGFVYNGKWVFFATGVEKGESYENPRYLYAVHPLSGEIQWKTQLAASGWMPPALYEDQICLGLGEIYLDGEYGQLACYKQESGVATQSYNLKSPVAGLLQERKGDLVFSMQNGDVCSVDLSRQAIKWCNVTALGEKPVHTFASPVFVNDELVAYPSFNDGLLIFDRETGRTVSKWSDKEWGNIHSRPLLAVDGWYVTDYKGFVRKLRPRPITAKGDKKLSAWMGH